MVFWRMGMERRCYVQLNVYVPENRRDVVRLLEAASKRTGRAKNELVLEALDRFLRGSAVIRELGQHHLGRFRVSRRADIYNARLGRR